jgi:anti-anti-sigma factor
MSCTATVRKIGDVAIVDLSGRFTVGCTTGLIRDTVRDLLKSGERHILLNLREVTYLDSAAGIGELVSSYTTAINQGAQLKLLRSGKRVDYVLHVVRLDKVFEIHDDEDAAVRSFRTPKAGEFDPAPHLDT